MKIENVSETSPIIELFPKPKYKIGDCVAVYAEFDTDIKTYFLGMVTRGILENSGWKYRVAIPILGTTCDRSEEQVYKI